MRWREAIVTVVALLMVVGAVQWSMSRARPTPAPPEPPKPPPPPAVHYEDWNTYHGDSGLRGNARAKLPQTLAPLWNLKTNDPVRQAPVLHRQRLFAVTARGGVYAADLDGRELWSKELVTGEMQNGVPVRDRIDAPCACFEDTLLVGTVRGTVYAFDAATGNERWRAELNSPIMGTPNYLPAGAGPARVFVIERGEGVLHGLNFETGALLWKSEGVERCDGSPSVSPDAIVFGSCASALHVLSPDTGLSIRNIPLGRDSQVAGGVALDGGNAISGSRGGRVFEAEVGSGTIRWSNTDCESEVFATPAVTSERAVASSNDGEVFALDRATGKLCWKIKTGVAASSPVIAEDKVLVTDDGTLFMMALADGAKLWESKISDDLSSPAVSGDRVFVGSEDGSIRAFGPPRAGENKSP